MIRLLKMRYSADSGGEAAVKRPSPLPLLLGTINPSQYFEYNSPLKNGG
jgi:hypothetical protein